MSLHSDLLDHAEQLAQLDPRRPKQASPWPRGFVCLLRTLPPFDVRSLGRSRGSSPGSAPESTVRSTTRR